MRIRVEDWNRFVDGIFRSRLLQVRAADALPWRHPWHMTVKWSPELEGYALRVKPGFCLTGTTAGVSARGVDKEEVWLGEDPALPIGLDSWREIGTDAVSVDGGGERVPEYFLKRGVLDPVHVDTGGPGGLVQRMNGFVDTRKQARLLRACDVVLHHDRLTTGVDVSTGSGTDGTFAQFSTVLSKPPGQRDEAYLRIVRSWEPEPETSPLERLQGLPDKAQDTIKLATLYLLSTPGESKGAEPDKPGWTGFAAHYVFWNLEYRQKIEAPPSEPTVLRLPAPGLGAGTLGAVAGPMVALVNDNYAVLDDFFNGAKAAGKFFTV